jgi:uncharacterized protein YdbL (DUF1318 family)
MKTVTHWFSLFLTLMLLSSAALAVTLQEAKELGLIGERRDGYVGFVVDDVPADVRALVQNVNNQRRDRYREIADDNGITVAQVAAVAFERAVEATQSGHYLQDASGNWVRK